MTELIYLSEQKLYRRLGIPQTRSTTDITSTFKAPFIEMSGSESWSREVGSRASLEELAEGIKKLEKLHDPAQFTNRDLRPGRWVRFELDMAHVAVHKDSGRPPEDIALFVGEVPAGERGQTREMGFMLCGSVEHLRTRMMPAGRMGSDTTWLYDSIKDLERRDQTGEHGIPDLFMAESKNNRFRLELAAMGVYSWTTMDYPTGTRQRMLGHAMVLTDIDKSNWINRLLVASPLYVEIAPQRSGRMRWWRWGRTRR